MQSLWKMLLKEASFSLFLLLPSCVQTTENINNKEEKPHVVVMEKEAKEESFDNYQAELQRHMSELRQMDDKNQELKNRQEEKEVKNWIQGTWTWSGRMRVYDNYYMNTECTLLIDDDYIVSLTNGEVLDQGAITNIDLDKQIIHYGSYSYLEFNNNCQKIYLGSHKEKKYFRKVSNIASLPSNRSQGSSSQYRSGSNNSSSYGLRSSNNYSTVSFRTDTDVIAYTSSHTFRNNMGNNIEITFQGLYLNGNLITNAPRVLNFSGSGATISVSSPFNGGGAMFIRVDASRGTITDGSGDVFWIVD